MSQRERPILFSAPLVRAILAGTKTVTRRPVRRENEPDPGKVWDECLCREIDPSDTPCVVCDARFGACPFGAPGDRLWGRETLRRVDSGKRTERWVYGADDADVTLPHGDPRVGAMLSWAHHKESDTCVSIHMPRWASRILLEVTDVRAERLQDITEDDAQAEGIEPTNGHPERGAVFGCGPSHREGFAQKWIDIYGRESWDASPWVWRIAFKRIEVR